MTVLDTKTTAIGAYVLLCNLEYLEAAESRLDGLVQALVANMLAYCLV